MPFDPTYPPTNAEIESLPLRQQFQSLHQDTQTRATVTQMVNADNAVLAQTSANTNNVEPISNSAGSSYDEALQQEIIDKINELINALRQM